MSGDKPHIFRRNGAWCFRLRSWSHVHSLWPGTFESTCCYLRYMRDKNVA